MNNAIPQMCALDANEYGPESNAAKCMCQINVE